MKLVIVIIIQIIILRFKKINNKEKIFIINFILSFN